MAPVASSACLRTRQSEGVQHHHVAHRGDFCECSRCGLPHRPVLVVFQHLQQRVRRVPAPPRAQHLKPLCRDGADLPARRRQQLAEPRFHCRVSDLNRLPERSQRRAPHSPIVVPQHDQQRAAHANVAAPAGELAKRIGSRRPNLLQTEAKATEIRTQEQVALGVQPNFVPGVLNEGSVGNLSIIVEHPDPLAVRTEKRAHHRIVYVVTVAVSDRAGRHEAHLPPRTSQKCNNLHRCPPSLWRATATTAVEKRLRSQRQSEVRTDAVGCRRFWHNAVLP
jgi:hypothetical protein